MTNKQRTVNDNATTDRRELEDRNIRDHRIRNDELTVENRAKADKALNEHRLRNDHMTTQRRALNDGNPGLAFAIFLLILIVLTIGAYMIYT